MTQGNKVAHSVPSSLPDEVELIETPVLTEKERSALLELSPRREQIAKLIEMYPGLNSNQMGEILGVSPANVAGVLCDLIEKTRVHRIRPKMKADRKVPPYVYFYGRDVHGRGADIQGRKRADEDKENKSRSKSAVKQTAPVQPASSASSVRATSHRQPPPPVPADPTEFEMIEALERSQETQSKPLEHDATAHPAAVPPAISADREDIVHVSFDTRPSAPSATMPAPPPVAAPRPTRTLQPPAAAHPVAVAAPSGLSLTDALSGAIDELSDKLSVVVDQLADRFSENISTVLSEHIIRAISERLNQKLHQKTVAGLENVIDKMLPQEMASIESETTERAKLSSVVIVGLLPEQENMIKNEFKDCFRLKFWKDGNPKSLREISGNADHILTFVDKIGHKHEDAILASGKRPDRVTGGMSSLRKRLTEIYVNH